MVWLALAALAALLFIPRKRPAHVPVYSGRSATIIGVIMLAFLALRTGRVSVALGLGLFAAGLLMFWRLDDEKKVRAAGSQPVPPPRGAMSAREAYAVLGLPPGASAEAIKQAHRSLMKLAHPDAGGTTHRAACLNEARDRLLG
jgi:hypothetical protein